MIRKIIKKKIVLIAFFLMSIMVFFAITAPFIAPYDPYRLDPMNRLHPPGRVHLLGTDGYGRDVFSRVIYGARFSLMVGISVALFTLVFGGIAGLLSGYNRKADMVVMRIMDAMMALPSIMLALFLVGAFGAGFFNVIIALGITYMPRLARVVRGSVLVVRETTYVEAAKALGTGTGRIIIRHIIPNIISPVIVQMTFTVAFAIIVEATLSFLGVGIPPYVPSWGSVIANGRDYLRRAPWLVFSPGFFIMATVFSLNVIGDAIRDQVDPKLQRVV